MVARRSTAWLVLSYLCVGIFTLTEHTLTADGVPEIAQDPDWDDLALARHPGRGPVRRGLAQYGTESPPGSYSPPPPSYCAEQDNRDVGVCRSCRRSTGCSACAGANPFADPPVPWRALSNAGGTQPYNSCETCDALLGCASAYDCGPGIDGYGAGCYACPPGAYLKRVRVQSVGTKTSLTACASCRADFGCDNCTAAGCACPAGQFWAPPAGPCTACPAGAAAAAAGCAYCQFSACGLCPAGCVQNLLTREWAPCSELVSGCKACSRRGTCMLCAYGYFPGSYNTCKTCAQLHPRCKFCDPRGSGVCHECSKGYAWNSTLGECALSPTCQELAGTSCAWCKPGAPATCGWCLPRSYWNTTTHHCEPCTKKYGSRCWLCTATKCSVKL